MNRKKVDDKNKETDKLEKIKIREGTDEGRKSYLEYAQKEMEIIVSLVENITKIIIQSRYFLILSLTILFGYLLKINESLEPITKIYFLFFGFILILVFLANEILVTTWQRAHINRLWQLDTAINEKIMVDYEKLQEIIIKDKKVNFELNWKNILKLVSETMAVVSLSVFYISLILLVLAPTWYVQRKDGLGGLPIYIVRFEILVLGILFINFIIINFFKKSS